MKKHFTQTLLLILAFNCGVYAQSYEIKEGSIYLGEKQRNGLICYVDAPAKLLMNAWQAHLTQNFGVNLDKKKNDDNNLFTANKVVLAGITRTRALIEPRHRKIFSLTPKSSTITS